MQFFMFISTRRPLTRLLCIKQNIPYCYKIAHIQDYDISTGFRENSARTQKCTFKTTLLYFCGYFVKASSDEVFVYKTKYTSKYFLQKSSYRKFWYPDSFWTKWRSNSRSQFFLVIPLRRPLMQYFHIYYDRYFLQGFVQKQK